jgi:hypothetical protein
MQRTVLLQEIWKMRFQEAFEDFREPIKIDHFDRFMNATH